MRSRRRARLGHTDVIHVDLPCTEPNKKAVRTIARDIVKTSCIDRIPVCDERGKIAVLATCGTPGAAHAFEKRLAKFTKLLKANP